MTPTLCPSIKFAACCLLLIAGFTVDHGPSTMDSFRFYCGLRTERCGLFYYLYLAFRLMPIASCCIYYGPSTMDCISCLLFLSFAVVYRPSTVDCGLWSVDFFYPASCILSFTVDYRPSTVDYGLWSVDYSLN
jgi:hypothetical protein